MRAILFALMLFFSSTAFADVDPIVNTALQSGSITRADARNLYLLKNRTWADGARIQVFRLPLNSNLHKEFVRDVLKMNQTQFEAEWQKLINAGLAPAVEEVPTAKAMLTTISRKPAGVGYLSHDYLVLYGAGFDVQIIRITD
jgi:ABC-type phosphate transport system substrate-binding protein